MSSNSRMAKPQTAAWVVEIGVRLQRIRSAFHLTQTELAERTGLATSALNQWEKGVHPPSLEKAIILRENLGITLDWLYFGDIRGLTPDQITNLTTAKLPAPSGRKPREIKPSRRRMSAA